MERRRPEKTPLSDGLGSELPFDSIGTSGGLSSELAFDSVITSSEIVYSGVHIYSF